MNRTALTICSVMLMALLPACATSRYTSLDHVDKDDVEQLKENVFRVEYRVSSFTPQEQLDKYLLRRCADLTIREGYDYFHLSQRFDVLMMSRRTSITVTMFKGEKPSGVSDMYDAKTVVNEPM